MKTQGAEVGHSGRVKPGGMSGCKRFGAERTASGGDNADSGFHRATSTHRYLSVLSISLEGGRWMPVLLGLTSLSNLLGRYRVPKCAPSGNTRFHIALLPLVQNFEGRVRLSSRQARIA